jgi:hypothetical protein
MVNRRRFRIHRKDDRYLWSLVRQITKRRSEELRNGFGRLMYLKWQTVVSYGTGDEAQDARRRMEELREEEKGGGGP